MNRVERVTKRRLQRERGAVAVVVALLSVVLIGVSAFSIDFGMSYVSTRQLQTASDAAVLAATATYKDAVGNCTTLAADTTLRTQANAVGEQIRNQNRPGATGAIEDVKCTADSKGLEITYRSSGTTPSLVGPIFGRTSDYATDRPATAELRVPDGIGVRPYALCGSQVPATIPSRVFRMELPSSGSTICPGADAGGNWWTIDCPEDANNSSSGLGDATLDGCDQPISIVPGQGSMTGAALRSHLTAQCPDRSPSCLSANPGSLSSVHISNALEALVDAQEMVILPVFCGVPPCDAAAISPDNGNGTIYPVQALLAVEVCGFHFGPRKHDSVGVNPNCSGVNNSLPTYRSTDSGDNYLLLRAQRIQLSGKSDDSECAVGDPLCDKGLRKVELTR